MRKLLTANISLQNEIKQFYDRICFPGSYPTESVTAYQQTWNNIFIDFIVSNTSQDKKVLDVGCGSGLIANVLSYHIKCPITAIDWSESISHGKAVSLELGTDVCWVQQGFENFSAPISYDVIICQGVLHHMPEWQSNISKIKRLLSPNGTLLLAVYHPMGKFLQKFAKKFYNNDLLKVDQTENPFELSWTGEQVKKICEPLSYIEKTPKFINLDFVFNGGLTLYKFVRTTV